MTPSAGRALHILLVGPVATADVQPLLGPSAGSLPIGYAGAPLMRVLIDGLLARGHRVTAVTTSADLRADQDDVRTEGSRFTLVICPSRPRAWRFNGWRSGRVVDLFAFERRRLAEAIRRIEPDVVHAHWAYEFAWAAQRAGVPLVVTSHDAPLVIARFSGGLVHGGYRWLRACMAWRVLRRAEHVTTVSPYMVGQIQSWCPRPVSVVPNPLAAGLFGMSRTESPGRLRVLMVCNGWSARKNPEPALRAFAKVSAQVPQAELVMLGADFGPGERAERWWTESALVGQVRFVGSVSHAEVLRWMTVSDLLLHPALEESFGAVIAEAMALQLPVLAGADSGAVPWIIGQAGVTVDVRSARAMAAAMLRLLVDDAGRRDLGVRARDSVHRRFGADEVVMQYEALYRAALGEAPDGTVNSMRCGVAGP